MYSAKELSHAFIWAFLEILKALPKAGLEHTDTAFAAHELYDCYRGYESQFHSSTPMFLSL
jgi:hypothetical protein